MSVTYPDLTNDFPDVASDERYLYRDVAMDDLTYIVQYETLVNAAKTASDSDRQEKWEALVAFKETEDYKNHVYPVLMAADKLQTLEDKAISAQRFAKRQKQQWNISETEPEANDQAVGDIWLRNDGENEEGIIDVTPFYKGEDGEYHEMGFSSSSELKEEVENIQQDLTTIEQNLSGLKFQIVETLPESPDPETLYIITKG